MKEPITELQMLLMDQQQSIDDIHKSLLNHATRFAEIEKKLQLVELKLTQLLEYHEQEEPALNDKPPHY